MKRIISILVLGMFLSNSYSQEVNDEFLIIQDQKIHIDILIGELSKNLPQIIDGNTRWVQVRKGKEKKSIVYLYLITSMGKDDFHESGIELLKNDQKPFLQNFYCTQPGFVFLRENNVKLEHNYSDKNNQYLFSIYTENSDCVNNEEK